ncbi:outer membrane beta-barrel protein [Solimonas soli]|uniref:outer membrane beta-barrel protein n=1 Tax=Solimonas soli TaxID=413479 RepID=UPI0012FCBFDD|nr:outer membrane beta-barrel protein [Solimonas soli]
MKSFIRALGLVAALSPMSSFAGLYVGASGLKADRSDYSDVDPAYGGKAYLGYRFSPVPIMLEASYIDTGDADVDGGIKMNFSGYTLGAGYFLELTPKGSGLWLRGAWYSGDTEIKVPAGSLPQDPGAYGTAKQSSDGGSLGLGLVWKLSDWFGLRLEYETLFGPKDFADDKDIGILSAGLMLEFGHGGRTSSARRADVDYGYVATPAPAPEPAPVYAQPAPPPAPTPVPVPAPAASDTRAAQPLPLKLQPRSDASTVVVLPAGAGYQSLQRIHNSEGDWSFVQYDGRRGWLHEDAAR